MANAEAELPKAEAGSEQKSIAFVQSCLTDWGLISALAQAYPSSASPSGKSDALQLHETRKLCSNSKICPITVWATDRRYSRRRIQSG